MGHFRNYKYFCILAAVIFLAIALLNYLWICESTPLRINDSALYMRSVLDYQNFAREAFFDGTGRWQAIREFLSRRNFQLLTLCPLPGTLLNLPPHLLFWGVQTFFWGMLAWGCQALGSRLFGRYVGLGAALLVISCYNCAIYDRNYMRDFTLAAPLIWQTYALVKLRDKHFRHWGWAWLGGLCLLLGMLGKPSYLPCNASILLLWGIICSLKQCRQERSPRALCTFCLPMLLAGGLIGYTYYLDLSFRSGVNANIGGSPSLPYLLCAFPAYLISTLQCRLLPYTGILYLVALILAYFYRKTRRQVFYLTLLLIFPNVMLLSLLVASAKSRYLAQLIGIECLIAASAFRRFPKILPWLTGLFVAMQLFFVSGYHFISPNALDLKGNSQISFYSTHVIDDRQIDGVNLFTDLMHEESRCPNPYIRNNSDSFLASNGGERALIGDFQESTDLVWHALNDPPVFTICPIKADYLNTVASLILGSVNTQLPHTEPQTHQDRRNYCSLIVNLVNLSDYRIPPADTFMDNNFHWSAFLDALDITIKKDAKHLHFPLNTAYHFCDYDSAQEFFNNITDLTNNLLINEYRTVIVILPVTAPPGKTDPRVEAVLNELKDKYHINNTNLGSASLNGQYPYKEDHNYMGLGVYRLLVPTQP